jgi:hypothetical protein
VRGGGWEEGAERRGDRGGEGEGKGGGGGKERVSPTTVLPLQQAAMCEPHSGERGGVSSPGGARSATSLWAGGSQATAHLTQRPSLCCSVAAPALCNACSALTPHRSDPVSGSRGARPEHCGLQFHEALTRTLGHSIVGCWQSGHCTPDLISSRHREQYIVCTPAVAVARPMAGPRMRHPSASTLSLLLPMSPAWPSCKLVSVATHQASHLEASLTACNTSTHIDMIKRTHAKRHH